MNNHLFHSESDLFPYNEWKIKQFRASTKRNEPFPRMLLTAISKRLFISELLKAIEKRWSDLDSIENFRSKNVGGRRMLIRLYPRFLPNPAHSLNQCLDFHTQIASGTSAARGVDGGTLCPFIKAFLLTQVTLGAFRDLLAISQHTISS